MINQILPTYKNNRKKRGALNILGSFIKVITGNLDNNDAEKYNSEIQELFKNQDNIKLSLKKQISLSLRTITEFEKTISNLTFNQNLLNENLNSIISQINNITKNETESQIQLKLTNVLNQKLFLMEQISFILTTLIDAITFAKINTFHPSIINVDHFLIELQNIESQLISEQLPKSVNLKNILYYEKIVNVKAFVRDKSLIFILEIPLTYKKSFDYYELIPTPIKNDQNYYYLIATSRYLLIDNEVFASPTPKCKEVSLNEYLCESSLWIPINNNSPCETQLIAMTTNYSSCKHHYQNFITIWNRKVTNTQWIFVTPYKLRIKKSCDSQTETDILDGSYLIYIPPGCSLSYENTSITSHNDIRHLDLQIPILDFIKENSTKAQLPLIHSELRDTSLKTSTNDELISLQEEVSQIGNTSKSTTTISILAYLIWIPFISFVVWKTYLYYRSKIPTAELLQELQEASQSWIP